MRYCDIEDWVQKNKLTLKLGLVCFATILVTVGVILIGTLIYIYLRV